MPFFDKVVVSVAAHVLFFLALAPAWAESVTDKDCDVESTATAVLMLQQSVSVQAKANTIQLPPSSINELMQALLPVRFVHLPKCGGTAFYNAIFSLPGVCNGEPDFRNKDRWIGETQPWNCPGFIHEIAGHGCLQPLLSPSTRGHFVGMFRQPEQRLISLHRYATEETTRMPGSPFANPPSDVRVFFEHARGGMVHQLTHDDNLSHPMFCTGHLPSDPPVTDADVEEAVRVIQEDFAFVGITEHWDLSICLLHEMFGGPCTMDQLQPVNVGLDPDTGEVRPLSEYDVSVLEGAVDTQDRILYDAALSIFEHNLEAYGVTVESCEQGCWATARR